jgi:hypothetical protein
VYQDTEDLLTAPILKLIATLLVSNSAQEDAWEEVHVLTTSVFAEVVTKVLIAALEIN